MSSFLDFLQYLSEEKVIFTKDQLLPVEIQKPGEKPPEGTKPPVSPPPTGGPEREVHVLPPEDDSADGEPGEQDPNVTIVKPEDEKQDGEKDDSSDSDSSGEKKDDDFIKDSETGKEKGKKPKPKKEEKRTSFDSHDILEKSDAEEARDMAEKIFKEAERKREERGTEGTGSDQAGGFLEKLSGIYKSTVDWKAELKSRLNVFKSRSIRTFSKIDLNKPPFIEGKGKLKSRSYITGAATPRGQSDPRILVKGPWKKSPSVETALIIAMDTSGSMGLRSWEKVFGEMDKIARNFEKGVSVGGSTIKGQVYFMAWDTSVEQVEKYKPGNWKQYVSGEPQSKSKSTVGGVVGGGGTDPTCIYNFIDSRYYYEPEKYKHVALLNLLGDPKTDSENNISIPMKSGRPEVLPFIIIATDGYFSKMSESNIGKLYKYGKDNIVYLITEGTPDNVYPNDDKNIIIHGEQKI